VINIHKSNRSILLVSCFFMMLSLTICQVGFSQEIPFYWDRIDVDLNLQTNGDLLVTETQTYIFSSDKDPQRHRYLPIDRIDEIRDVSVTENGKPIATETGIKDRNFWIEWQHELTSPSTHTFVLKYRAVGGLETIGSETTLNWWAIFPTRSAPVKAAQVRVHLPVAVATNANVSTTGSPTIATKIDAETMEYTSTKAIEPQQSLIVTASFPTNILNLPLARWQQSPSSTSSIFDYFLMSLPWLFFGSIAFLSLRSLIPNTVHRSNPHHRTHDSGSEYLGGFWGGYSGGGDGGSGGDGGGGGDGGSGGDGGGGG
jgi:uncharacterized membrane protein YgcG